MKITPVQGVPTIQQPTQGISPDKIERAKTLARGEKVEDPKEKITLGEVAKSTTQTIKMNTNRTPEENLVQALEAKAEEPPKESDGPLPTKEVEPTTQEPAVSDNDVLAKSPVESTRQISPQLANLAKRERALQVKERELADKEKVSTTPSGLEALKQKALNGQALSVLEELGIPKEELYQRLTDEILGNKSNSNVDALSKKFEELQKSIDERLAKKDSEQEEAVYDHISRNIGILSRTKPEFRLIKESASENEVLELMKRTWKQDGIVLDEEEAMKMIETELREDAKRYASILGELDTPAPAQTEQVQKPEEQRFKTLTNKDSARPALSRRQRAIAVALGQK